MVIAMPGQKPAKLRRSGIKTIRSNPVSLVSFTASVGLHYRNCWGTDSSPNGFRCRVKRAMAKVPAFMNRREGLTLKPGRAQNQNGGTAIVPRSSVTLNRAVSAIIAISGSATAR